MTDARLRGEWLNHIRFDSLSDAAWRVFTGACLNTIRKMEAVPPWELP